MPENPTIVTADGIIVPALFREPVTVANAKGLVVLAHGITAEKTECGLFSRTADAIIKSGFKTLQFDFRGHGDSTVRSVDMTIEGETLDLSAAITWSAQNSRKVFLLAASFGAVAALMLPREQKKRIEGLLLWNPVFSLQRTFITPELAWQQQNFGKERVERGQAEGHLLIDGAFAVGTRFLEEVGSLHPEDRFSDFECPVLVIHGDRDTYTSFQIAETICESHSSRVQFQAVEGAEHGFGRQSEEAFVTKASVDFLLQHS